MDDTKLNMNTPMRQFYRRGEPWVWVAAAAMSLILLILAALVGVILVNGLDAFWPARVTVATLKNGQRLMGEITHTEPIPEKTGRRLQFKTGNRDLSGLDFRWVDRDMITRLQEPADALVLERQEYGNFYGFLKAINVPDAPAASGPDVWDRLVQARKQAATDLREVDKLRRKAMALNQDHERLRLRLLALRYHSGGQETPEMKTIRLEQETISRTFNSLVKEHDRRMASLRRVTVTVATVNGQEKVVPLPDIVRAYRPNQMTIPGKILFYLGKGWELLSAEPRESNTEGGLFPAIFGTVLMVFLMSILSFPLGVIGGIYLCEYAREGPLVRLVRVAVNNLAGIPSIVFGIFGLGFFVYGVGGALDALFFPERLPTPTFGTGGILWASLTLGLLTVPVVIVSTEEALGAIPGGIKEASLSLGATQFQTLCRLLLPMASPGILTGFILAMARAAGEVAPLMITGVVKLAPALPLDGTFPFLHVERKFMHLGFHIYDLAFQSPNVEAARPMVFVTTMLLVLIVLVMCSAAIHVRNTMKRRYSVKSI